jgi:TfoX/Sxy family transcriptional regulator of competence genes
MPYWEAPAEILEDEDDLRRWASDAIAVAHAAPTQARRKRRS